MVNPQTGVMVNPFMPTTQNAMASTQGMTNPPVASEQSVARDNQSVLNGQSVMGASVMPAQPVILLQQPLMMAQPVIMINPQNGMMMNPQNSVMINSQNGMVINPPYYPMNNPTMPPMYPMNPPQPDAVPTPSQLDPSAEPSPLDTQSIRTDGCSQQFTTISAMNYQTNHSFAPSIGGFVPQNAVFQGGYVQSVQPIMVMSVMPSNQPVYMVAQPTMMSNQYVMYGQSGMLPQQMVMPQQMFN